jgi:AcrR family transcriptional regulator
MAEIIDAAMVEFAEKGFEKTSMDSIARRANLSKGGVYHHFKSKDDILLAANARVTEPARYILNEIESIESSVEKLRAYIKRYLTYWTKHSKALVFTYLSLSKSLADSRFFGPYDDYGAGTMTTLEKIYQEGILKKEFREHDSKARALALITALDGVTMYLNTSKRLKFGAIKKHFLQVFVQDLLEEK